ncbi:MAG: hypothetical protein ACLVJH_02840 [Faecalibacterium prausnitzii]
MPLWPLIWESWVFSGHLTFLVQTVDRLPGVTIPVPSMVLPVGILFFTFKG